MQRNAKVAVAITVIGFGTAAALMFRKDAPSPASGGDEPATTLPYRASKPATARPDTQPVVAAGSASPTSAAARQDAAVALNDSALDRLPALPPHFDSRPPGASAAPGADRPPWQTAPPSTDPQPNTPRPPFLTAPINVGGHGPTHQRTHTVIDGDTLRGLAKRYLGSGNRGDEIYQLNRDQLLDGPDVLPIGTVLKIPARPPSPAPPRSDDASPADLVPIPPGLFRQQRPARNGT